MDILEAPRDADTLIVNTAVELAQTHPNIMIAGTDSFLILHCKQDTNAFFHKPGTQQMREETICIHKCQDKMNPTKYFLFFARSWWLRYYISTIWPGEEESSYNAWEKSRHLPYVDAFYDSGTSTEEITLHSEKCILALNGAVVVVVNHCFTSLFSTKGILSDIVIQ